MSNIIVFSQGNDAVIHLSFDEMLAYSQNRISTEARLRIAAHLQQCEFCRRELAVITNTLEKDKNESLSDLPIDLMRRVLASAQRQRSKGSEQRSLPIRIQYDSHISPTVQGIRGYAQDRQILFSSGSYDTDLHIFSSGSSQFSLQGQILSQNSLSTNELEGILVILTNDESTHRVVISDALGRFFISDLVQGTYTLTIELSDGKARLQSLQIG